VNILAIETSCDETSAAIVTGKRGKPVLLSNIVSSQIPLHQKYGGVVPEVAARAHIENILTVIRESLVKAKVKLSEVDYLAVTEGPGLVGSLVVGVETAKALSLSLNIPVLPINHLEGHIYANFEGTSPKFPLIALLVSGGHTLLIYMKSHLNYKVIGKTRDDAAGEAFDKGAKLMGLGYPGGPIISKMALEGNENVFKFPMIDLTPRPIKNKKGFLEKQEISMDYSFSGLKTALLNIVKKKMPKTEKDISDLAASYQKAIVDNLIQNSLRAIVKYQPRTFILSGGVAANRYLREKLGNEIKNTDKKVKFIIPPFELCTDNAGMIGIAAWYTIKLKSQNTKNRPRFIAEPNLGL
jgi:N6-L-threonylcarbamoyladenine synthase